ncbi:MAG TPA: alanine dehydrogenase [Phycisphaerales bacterium]|nr:alanine dehydrogenase [Phycisphaerales bacterium]
MIVGCVAEVKSDEYRVGLRPVGAELLMRDKHRVLVQTGAGLGSGYRDEDYEKAGATIVKTAAEVWGQADLVVKVKEPQPKEIPMMRKGQQLFTYFHFAADKELTIGCLNSGITAIVYETLEQPAPGGRFTLPLLTPMSEVAGKMSVQEGAKYLERPQGGRGILLGGVTGVPPANVLVLGGGVVGINAARMAAGLGAHVTVTDINLDRLRYLDEVMPANVTPTFSDPHMIREAIKVSDLVVGGVLISGAKAPHLITKKELSTMMPGSVIVDVSIDQGGCVETSRPTTHKDPIYTVDGIIHYCVANIPGAVPRTSTMALTNATLPWLLRIANEGAMNLAKNDVGFAMAINMDGGRLYNRSVAEAHGLETVKAPFPMREN